MEVFRLQQFSVKQSAEVFRVGTDAMLLGAMADVPGKISALEIGTGTGIISLILAQRNPQLEILAIDIDENAANLAEENFRNSVFSDRLSVQQTDFNIFNPEEKFDLIISNPPFFDENISAKDKIARQKVALSFEDLIFKSAVLLREEGVFSVIIPSADSQNFIDLAKNCKLHLIHKINIFGIEGGSLRRNILEFSLAKKEISERDFTIEKRPRIYSPEYLELTKDLHLFQ
ncbi:tRNA1(Val) (adenine(37)-N6)-methyltransferase [Cruoricaptor ignavus]|uniref:tRNA1(Val) (adenine(37)-N6)-methyltransferase n=1 Tax=Cruoricaptor ignavus TaxID=1118202 RepID=UPI00370D00E6